MGEEGGIVPLTYTYTPARPLVPTASAQAEARPSTVPVSPSWHFSPCPESWQQMGLEQALPRTGEAVGFQTL